MNKHVAVLLFVLMSAAQVRAQDTEKGRAVYQAVCIVCHAPENVMVSSPKAGDVREWSRRASLNAAGLRQLTDHAIAGLGAMPPKGGRADLSREQIQNAIEFMRQPSTKDKSP